MVSHFDFIPIKDEIYDLVRSDTEANNYGGNFELLGYESTLSLVNYGDAILSIISFASFMVISKMIHFALKKINKLKKVQTYFEE